MNITIKKQIKDAGLLQYFFCLSRKSNLILLTGFLFSVLSACSGSYNSNHPPKAVKHIYPEHKIVKQYKPVTSKKLKKKLKKYVSNHPPVKQKIGKPYKIAGKKYYPKHQPDYNKIGIASWYGSKFHGRKTANGETYNMYQLTAAHKTLPLPSIAKVTNLKTKKSIIVRVNDRGPFVNNRIIDLSMKAAEILGFKNKGIEKVKVEYISPATKSGNAIPKNYYGTSKRKLIAKQDSVKHKDPLYQKKYSVALSRPRIESSGHYVQVQSFQEKNKAIQFGDHLTKTREKLHIQSAWVKGNEVYRVMLGPYHSLDHAKRAKLKVKSIGYQQAFITSVN